MKNIILLKSIVLLLFPLTLTSQSPAIDSLTLLMAQKARDTLQVKRLNQLANLWFQYSTPESKSIATQSLNLAKELNFKQGELKALLILTKTLDNLGKTDSAIQVAHEVKGLAASLNDSMNYAESLMVLGNLESTNNDDDLAIDYLFKALNIAERNNYLAICSNSCSAIAIVNMGLGHVEVSQEYLERALQFAEEIPDVKLITKMCINLSIAYDSLDLTRKYINRAIKIATENNLNRELTYAYNTLGTMHLYNLDQVDSSLYFKKIALQRAKKTGESSLIQMITKSIADAYYYSDLDSAEHYLFKTINDFEVETYSFLQYRTLRSIAEIKNQKLEFEDAYHLLDSAYDLAEVQYRENMELKVAEANTRYETEKNKAEIARQDFIIQKQTNTRNLIILTAILLVALLGILAQYFINRQKRLKKESEIALIIEKERNQSLEEIDRAKTDLFNNISHELRTPLTMIIGPLEQTAQKIKNIHLQQDVNLALSNSKRLKGLINEILDLSKLDAGKLEVQNDSVSLYRFLSRVIHSFSSLAASQYIVLDNNLNEAILHSYQIKTDIKKLESIINNLISNAIKFSKSGDTINVNLDHDKLQSDRLRIQVIDEGPGITEQDQSRIFERYYQVKGNQYQGTGIGLALTKELCDLLGGDIKVNSKLDKGTTFTFQIPVQLHKAADVQLSEELQPISESQLSPIQINGNRPSVLIVEDDLQMVKYLKGILKDYTCEVAYNGQQAIEMLSKQSYDLISSDVMMPEMDGFTFREKVKEDPRLKNTPFIMLTARALEEDKLRGLQMGIDDYLTKPFNAEELKARVYNLIKNKMARAPLSGNDEPSQEDQFLDKAKSIVVENLDNTEFKVSDLAEQLHYSSRQLGRNLKRIIGLSPVEFILEIRLQHAYDVIQKRSFSTLNEVRLEVGIESASYFSSKFKGRFGITPSELMNSR